MPADILVSLTALLMRLTRHDTVRTRLDTVCRLFPLAGMLLRRERDRVFGRLIPPPPPSLRAPPPREVAQGVPFPTSITAEQVLLNVVDSLSLHVWVACRQQESPLEIVARKHRSGAVS